MATKQEWREYFKLINNREPSMEEFKQAIANGEITDVTSSAQSQTAARPIQAAQQNSHDQQPNYNSQRNQQSSSQQDIISIFKNSIYENGKISTNFILALVGVGASILVVPIIMNQIMPSLSWLFVLIALALVIFFYWRAIRPSNFQGNQQSPGAAGSAGAARSSKVQGFDQGQPTSPHQLITMGQAFSNFWHNYTNFSGRSYRGEYWYVVLANVLIGIIPGIIVLVATMSAVSSFTSYATTGYGSTGGGAAGIVILVYIAYGIYGLVSLLPTIGLILRRHHDLGMTTGQTLFLYLAVPAIILVLMLIPGINIIAVIAYFVWSIYLIVLLCQPSDKYLIKPEPLTGWMRK
ncbi:MAG: DUF805 domain-containing protein [Streptococcaceae bacterium]|jgi:uncharacterized membrane protein YhaH (DUF805 family)|nr:DUF805 domain-containing protein [Streptococcaceae bacterium]